MKLNHWIVLAVDALATLGPLAAVLSDAGYGKASLVVGGIVSMAVTLTAMWMKSPGSSEPVVK